MKKLQIRHILMLLAVLPAFFISCTKDEEVKLDFDITVPTNWTHYILDNQNYIYAAGRNPVNENDTILEAIHIYKTPLENWTLSLYYNTIKQDILASRAYEELMEEKDTVINETNFKRMISRETQLYISNRYNDTSYLNAITTRYFFFEKNNGYNMVLISIDTSYHKNKPIFDGIMNSFHYKY